MRTLASLEKELKGLEEYLLDGTPKRLTKTRTVKIRIASLRTCISLTRLGVSAEKEIEGLEEYLRDGTPKSLAELRDTKNRLKLLRLRITLKRSDKKRKLYKTKAPKTLKALDEEVAGLKEYLVSYSSYSSIEVNIVQGRIRTLEQKILELERIKNK